MNCVVVTGARDWWDQRPIYGRLSLEPPDTVFIEGGAPGADLIVSQFCQHENRNYITVNANWKRYRRAAGPIRNGWMLDMKPRLVIAFWKESSHAGTDDCTKQAKARGIPVETITWEEP